MTPPDPPEHALNIKGTSNAVSAARRNRFTKKEPFLERSEEARSPLASSDRCGFPRWECARIVSPPRRAAALAPVRARTSHRRRAHKRGFEDIEKQRAHRSHRGDDDYALPK